MNNFLKVLVYGAVCVAVAFVLQLTAIWLSMVLTTAATPVFGLVGAVALVALGALLAAWLWDKMFVWFGMGALMWPMILDEEDIK